MPIDRNRDVTRGTRANLIDGLRGRPMSEAAVDAALTQAAQFAGTLCELYEAHIAAGEVGVDGSGLASDTPILANRAPTALMYGRVQSGKTAAMILTTALCLDNGFRVVVVLTADNVALVKQTANRFRALNGPIVLSSVKDDGYEWEGQEDEIREDISADGLVLVCAKDAFHLPRVIEFLQEIEAPAYPTLVLDDEADAATPDTTLEARTSGRANAPQFPSTIHRRVLENGRPGEEGESIGEVFPHRLYVQVTATPYIFFLQRTDSYIRPDRTWLLESGAGYCGGQEFFGAFDPGSAGPPAAPLILVPANEVQAINRRTIPPGLRASVEFFLLSSVALGTRDGWPAEGFKHLSHSSARIAQHGVVARHIERHIREILRELRSDPPASLTRFADAYRELQRTVTGLAALGVLLAALPGAIRQAEIIRVNSDTDVPEYGPRINFLVGGNILGRGLTIDDLLVTYYVREAQVSQMDTVWQHARMYGYRLPLMPFTRVYLPAQSAARFKGIHETEEYLRDLLRSEAAGENVPLRVAQRTRPTRRNATEPAALTVIQAGEAQLHPVLQLDDVLSARAVLDILRAERVPTNEPDRAHRSTPIPIERVLDMIDLIPIPDGDPGSWHPSTMAAIVNSYRDDLRGEMIVYVRELQAVANPNRTRGRLAGPEVSIIRAAAGQAPALALLHVGPHDTPRGWYPTLVMPANSPAFIVNPN